MPGAPDIKSDDYYKVLGVDKGSTDNEIAKAYKKMALKYHPDKNPEDKAAAEENFKRITEAYEVLHEPEKRKMYDQFGKQGVQGGSGGGGPGGGVSFQQADEIFKAFFGGNDPFSMFFPGGGPGDDDDGFPGGAFFGGGNRGMPGGTRVVFRSGQGGGMPSMGGMPGGIGGMPGGMSFGGGAGSRGGMPGIGGKGGAPRPKPTPAYAMPNGSQVVIRGLAKAPEHNSKQGRIGSFDQEKGRYEVELEGDTTLSLRPSNLTQKAEVEIVGIESQPELNSAKGDIFGYDETNGRYNLRLKAKMANGRDVIGLTPSNVILPNNTRVVVQGLSNEAFNGQMAQIIDIDKEAARYTVQCQNGKQIKIKFDNVIC